MANHGSEWRRWELHLHTPGTKKEDHYIGKNDEDKWNNFYSAIEDYVGNGTDPIKTIAAIAVTDYLSIENYMKIKKDNRLPECIKLVIPNVELRITPIARETPINIHCIFDPAIVDQLNDRFFAKLSFKYQGNQFSATRNELIRLGRAFENNSSLDEEKAYNTGLNQYVIPADSLFSLFEKDPALRDKTIVVVSNSGNDGASGLKDHSDYFTVDYKNQLEATRRNIYQQSDMIFSSKEKDIAYFLGEGTDSKDVVRSKCGSLKPCVHGCDAHSADKVFKPSEDRYCWIKADPTFEGLKQVLYEPKQRVRICSTIPDEKPGYNVIDRVEIVGNPKFMNDPIYFSDKLTCIIGGKSTGKSLLLHNMAMAIDKNQVTKKAEIVKSNVSEIPELRVIWKDEFSSKDTNKQRKIIYIPQSYLNRLSDEEQETTEIDKIIESVILQDEKCNQLYQQLQKDIGDKKQELAIKIVDFAQLVQKKADLIEECKEIGDKQSIENEIDKLQTQLKRLSEEYNVTEEEMNRYQTAVVDVQSHRLFNSSVLKEINIINNLDSVLEEKNINYMQFHIYGKELRESITKVKEEADKIWISYRDAISSKAYKKHEEIEDKIRDLTSVVNELKPKMDGNQQIDMVTKKIVGEKEKLSRIDEQLKKIEIIQHKYIEELEQLGKSFDCFKELYSSFARKVNESFQSQSTDLEFSATAVFRADQFQKKVDDILNNRSFSKFQTITMNAINEKVLTPDNIKKIIESLIDLSSESLQFKSLYSNESGLRELLTDWYNINYTVKMGDDIIKNMSPGKKALVLLRLLISLAESHCPILIDQPEDDLDNRSIFDELIDFIRERKIRRQIITVTHNANIVLGGDAELVIVANQMGGDTPNNKYKFEYRGGSIEDNSPKYDADGNILPGILNQKGIQEHICEILEGGKQAFDLRRQKYQFITND